MINLVLSRNKFYPDKVIELKSRKVFFAINYEDREVCVVEENDIILKCKVDDLVEVEVKRILGGGAAILFSGRYGGDSTQYNIIYRDLLLRIKSKEVSIEVPIELGDDSINIISEDKIKNIEKELKNINSLINIKKTYKHFFK